MIGTRGLRVSVLKHAHHDFDIDRPGKDSFRHRQAGASEVLLASAARWVLMHELRGAREPTLAEYVAHFSPCDLVLVEGFKHEAIPEARGLSAGQRQAAAVARAAAHRRRRLRPGSCPWHPPAGLRWLDLNDVPDDRPFHPRSPFNSNR
jgi:molybdopterin-guanine dinucleotide biosynthesis protein B